MEKNRLTETDLGAELAKLRAKPLQIGLFDILQLDLLRDPGDIDIAAVYARRLDQLALADELGYAAAFIAERHFMPTFATPSATAWVAAATQRTSQMRLGALGYTLPIVPPVQLSEEIAVLDLLSNGRLEVGFGLGHRVEELAALGVDPADRIELFQERLALVQALWTGGSVSFESDKVILRDVAIAPLPLQAPHPPLWFAGTEPIGAHWMGSRGLGLAIGFKPTDQLRPTVTGFLAGRQMRSADMIEIEPARPLGTIALMRPVYVSDTDAHAIGEIAEDLLRLDERYAGSATEANRAERRESARTRATNLSQDGMMILGGPETVAHQIAGAREELAFDVFLANVHGAGVTDERVERSLRLLASDVRAAFPTG
jgi:alkanesulfonate monooxygenase SsuD/methylene tetrahydromethanopterin reductase-like flavin-dependent oxidoreductase (luciferase family)